MANTAHDRARLCLVTPADYEPAAFARDLADALGGGDVASLIITAPASDPTGLQRAAEALIPVARSRDVATLIHNDGRVAARTKADGVHVDTGLADIADAIAARRRDSIVGAGGIRSRDDAMEIGEAEPDYLFFGRVDGDFDPEIHTPSLDLAVWWSAVAVVPAIVMGGNSLETIDPSALDGVEFLALRRAIWEDPRGPAIAVDDALARLSLAPEIAG